MSREEVVFTKKAIVVVSVISVLVSNVVVGFMAAMWLWRFSDELKTKTVEAASAAAIAATDVTMRPIREMVIKHEVKIEAIEEHERRVRDRRSKGE